MPGGGWQGAPPPQTGFQRHHLIPVALGRSPQMAAMFDALCAEGFALQHFGGNGVVLPSCELAALQSGHALHRGPHHGYSDVVAALFVHISRCTRQPTCAPRSAQRLCDYGYCRTRCGAR